MITIRKAVLDDVQSIREIYNEAIVTTIATFDTEEKSLENRQDWFKDRNENFPILVAEKENAVAGYVALNKWSERKAYNITAEVSLYVNSNQRALGIGKQLLSQIVQEAKTNTKLHSLIARISAGNEQSIYLHKLNGFKVMGVMKEAGIKFGSLHDVTFMQLMLRQINSPASH